MTSSTQRPFAGASSGAEAWRRDQLIFPRQRSGHAPFEKSPPLNSWSNDILAGASLIIFMVLAFWTSSIWAPVLSSLWSAT